VVASTAESAPLDPRLRLEASLIERRIEQLARLDVEAARLEPTSPVFESLGRYPSDPMQARAWQEGAYALARYRRRYDVRDGTNPLGPMPRSEEARMERQRMQWQLEGT
jgi:hypothetical protein